MRQKLYALDSKGREKIWEVEIMFDQEGNPVMVKRFGLKDGKIQICRKVFKEGKASRTAIKQAELETKSAIKSQRDKGYYEEGENTSQRPILPMLAKDYDPNKLTFPVMAQEKLNGVRCIAHKLSEDTVRLTSRKGLEWTTLDNLKAELLNLMKVGEIWDGEIYHRELTLNQISSATKAVNEDTPRLQYWVYDQVTDEIFKNRVFSINETLFNIVPVFTWIFYDEYRLDEFYKDTVRKGGEGIMVRNPDGLYKGNLYRSKDLMKRKDFTDSEFEIVDFTFDIDGCVIWRCTVDTRIGPAVFNVVPMGTKESRQIGPEEAEMMIGMELTVRFSELSDYGVPQGNPVGITIRDYE